MPNQISTSIQPTKVVDAATIVKISKEIDATRANRHTELKRLRNISYLNKNNKKTHEVFKKTLKNRGKYVFIKAINDDDEVMGSANFCFKGFEQDEIPNLDPGEDETIQTPAAAKAQQEESEPLSEEKKRANTMIDRLEDMEGEDMEHWEKILMPPGSKCIIVTGLGVSPRFQYQGVGAALMKWGTDYADIYKVFMWVHSSEASYRVYAKSGSEVAGKLDIDLDAWASAPPPKEVGGTVWGHYLVRYMKRLPKSI
jgi:hypothetical protein